MMLNGFNVAQDFPCTVWALHIVSMLAMYHAHIHAPVLFAHVTKAHLSDIAFYDLHFDGKSGSEHTNARSVS